MSGQTLTDSEWLLLHRPESTEDDIEGFEERVSIMLDNFKGPINYAVEEQIRNQAFKRFTK